MAAAKPMYVRNMRTDEIREVTPEQREIQDKSVWVPITGDDVKPTSAADAPASPKTTPKATTPKE
jgi:hypothetical protein